MTKNRTHWTRSGAELAARKTLQTAIVRVVGWLEQNAPREKRAAFYRRLASGFPDLAKIDIVQRTCGQDLTPRPGDADVIAELDRTVPSEINQPLKAALDGWLKHNS